MEQKVTSNVVKGLIISLILIVFSLVVHFAGYSMNRGVSSLQYIIIVGGLIWACITYAKQMNHNVTFGNVFAHGFKTTAVITVIMIVYTVLALTVITPEIKDLALEEARNNMENSNISEDQMETALGISEKFFLPFAIGGVLLSNVIIGAIASLIGAAVAKKNPQSPFQQQTNS